MTYIKGKNFMFYIECKTLLEDLMLPLCTVETVSLSMQTEKREATKAPKSRARTWYYGMLDYNLSLDGLIAYSAAQIQGLLVEVNNALLMANNALVSVGGVPVNELSPYFCLENALQDWKFLDWYCEDSDNPGFKYKGTVLVEQIQNTWTANDNRKFSCSLQVDGDLGRFHTPIPTDLKLVGQSNTLPAETASTLLIIPVAQGSDWLSGVTLLDNPLPGGIFTVDGFNYTVQIGDNLDEIATALASLINASLPAGTLKAYSDDDSVMLLKDSNIAPTGNYTDHTGVLRSVFLSFTTLANYDFYRIKANDWIIDVTSNQPTIILPTGNYTLSVAGMGSDMQYSDYSETINITVS